MKRDVWIRADGSSRIGIGHQMRCLSIADALRKKGIEAVFLTADEDSAALPTGRGYHCAVLHGVTAGQGEQKQECEDLREICLKREAAQLRELFGISDPLLIIDSYAVTPAYLEALRDSAAIVYLDDYGRERWPADCIINYNIYSPDLPYDRLYGSDPGLGSECPEIKEKKPLLVLGSSYAPLREDFQKYKHVLRQKAEDVLITTGGADALNVAGQLAERLAACGTDNQTRYHVVSGIFHTFREELHELAGRYPQIIVHENVTEMARLMADCDLAVSAAGSTLYELCAVGVPTVCFHFVENQELPARYFAQRTAMPSCGNFAREPEAVLTRLYEEVRRLETDHTERARIAESMRSVCDGGGAERIAACLIEGFLRDN